MFILLLASALLLLVLVFYLTSTVSRPLYTKLGYSALYGIITLSGLIFIYTETFSLFNALIPTTAKLYWLFINGILFGYASYRLRQRFTLLDLWVKTGSQFKRILSGKLLTSYMFIGILLVLTPLFIVAILGPPNNLDSHNYHLNRALCWLQNQNVDHYPTMYVQQLYHNVMGEYLALTTLLLSETDRFANLVQFTSMVGSLIAVSLLAKQFGLTSRGQFISAVLLLSLPIGLFESTTTQVDYIACFYFICFVSLGYSAINHYSFCDLFFCLLSIVLGGFSKYTIFLFGLPFVIFFGIKILQKYGWLVSLKTLGLAFSFFGLVFGLFWARNYHFFGHILGPTIGSRLHNERIPVESFSVGGTMANIVRNIGLHLGLPNTKYNLWTDSLITRILNFFGQPLFDFANCYDQYYTRFAMQEDTAPNTINLLLLLIAGGIVVVHTGHPKIKILFLLAIIGFILFSAVFKFQSWSTRTQMPFFTLGCVVIAYVYDVLLKQRKLYPVALLYFVSVVIIFSNPSKMIIPVQYMAKSLFGYVPRDICPKSAAQSRLFTQVVSDSYDVNSAQKCFPLRSQYSFKQRLSLFNRLDSIGYFDNDKNASILRESRIRAYFQNHLADYTAFAPMLQYLAKNHSNVGILFHNNEGYYHFWSSLNEYQHHPVQMAYIYYRKEYTSLPNAHRQFRYQTILSNSIALVKKYIPKESIESIHQVNHLIVVNLKSETKTIYVF